MGKGGKKTPLKSTFPKNNTTPGIGGGIGGGLEALAKSGALSSTMKTLGGIGGAATAMGSMLLSNQHHLIAGIKKMEDEHRPFLEENGFEGLMYSFSSANIKGQDMMAVLVLPYNSEKKEFGEPLKIYNLGQFVQMLIESAQTIKK